MKPNDGREKSFLNKIVSLLFIMSFIGMVGVFSGCDDNVFSGLTDEDSFEYRLEDARIALDDQEYEVAIAILESLDADYPNNATVLSYLASARGGTAGLDTFNILTAIDDLSSNAGAGGFDIVGSVLGGGDSTLTGDEINTKLGQFASAISALEQIPEADRTEDQKIQLGLMSFNHAILSLANVISDQGTEGSTVTLTEAGVSAAVINPATDVDGATATAIANDINNIGSSIAAISSLTGSGSNDLTTEFNELVTDMDATAPFDGNIDSNDIATYINNL